MSTNGYSLRCGKRSGGINEIALINCGAVEGFEMGGTGIITSVVLKDGVDFGVYQFRQEDASFTEEVIRRNGAILISHQIRFMCERMDEHSRRAVEEIIKYDEQGFVAILTTAGNEKYVVGWSSKFGLERPLRIDSVKSTTGEKMSDRPGEVITLSSIDGTKASPYSPMPLNP